jgi:hypothetical protein
MFGKPPKRGALTDRVRSVAERKPAPVPKEAVPPREQEARSDRRPLFRHATLIFDSGQTLRVAIKNISRTGARIEFFTHAELPDELALDEPTLSLRRRARVVWQREGMAGLKFL